MSDKKHFHVEFMTTALEIPNDTSEQKNNVVAKYWHEMGSNVFISNMTKYWLQNNGLSLVLPQCLLILGQGEFVCERSASHAM